MPGLAAVKQPAANLVRDAANSSTAAAYQPNTVATTKLYTIPAEEPDGKSRS